MRHVVSKLLGGHVGGVHAARPAGAAGRGFAPRRAGTEAEGHRNLWARQYRLLEIYGIIATEHGKEIILIDPTHGSQVFEGLVYTSSSVGNRSFPAYRKSK